MKTLRIVPLVAIMIATGFTPTTALAWNTSPTPAPTMAPTPRPPVTPPTHAPVPVVVNNNQNQHQGQTQGQKQGQAQSLNNRLNQSLVNSPTTYNTVQEQAQLPMVNAPECGGVNAGVSADLQGSIALSAAVHFGRHPDSCVHHNEPVVAPPVTYVTVQAAPAPVVPKTVYRTVYVKQRAVTHRCASLSSGELSFYMNDLRMAKHTRDTARIHNDRAMLESACRGDLVDRAVDG